ncbi:sulfotransferase family protein [Mycobacteroides franklinii]|uniref:Sulfotransferase family protein n=1 Tax=Mycobacteroides franklinii TaxID=948102 RepID=A0A1S1L9X9_9MYCO|nr:sulfotransferase [Mycobacteroides franklinii]NGX09710.1 sulfotransferase [Mycobacteroides franklinii]OHU21772.1 sulfotransferase family protein [Mycobacteroides franklinii]
MSFDEKSASSTERTSVGTVDDLHESASRLIGLDDFGDGSVDNYREALGVLLDSYQGEAGLTPLGSKMSRVFLRGALGARLLSEAAFKAHPDYAQVAINRPIFVTGLPRTGTTALHRLLNADPMHQGLEMWLADFPQPRPARDTWDANPVYQQLEGQFSKHHVENPEFMGLHYMSASEVEECWQLLRQSVHSVSYECLAHVPSYAQWLSQQDWTPAYRRYKANLQLIGLNDIEKRWVLKNPSHLFALDALMEVYPDALVIQTHRPAETIIASVCSLNEHATAGWSDTFVGATLGADQLDTWARGLESFKSARTKYDESQFCDVDYFDFISDPIGTVESIYRHFGLELSASALVEMQKMNDESQKGPRAPKHVYSLADYGLSKEAVVERFAGL